MLAPLIPRKINLNGVAHCCLPSELERRKLQEELQKHPLYREIDVARLLQRQEPHRLFILSDDVHVATQLAACLAALRRKESDAMLVVPPSALARPSGPAQGVSNTPETEKLKPQASLLECGSPVLISADDGPVLTQEAVSEVELYLDNPTAQLMDIFVALQTTQIDAGRLDALTFSYGFDVCRIENVSAQYLCQVLGDYLSVNGVTLHEALSPEQVVTALRQRMGSRFTTRDIFTAVDRAVHSTCAQALTLEHLLPPCISIHGRALEQLDGMVGLAELKTQMKRMVATAALEKRRGVQGRSICRNLTFAGSPGTGKSETARIFARALRESGCSTGVFREVGREALVGQYVGETSLKVEKLFSEVRGGVLFIDEAGALVSDGRDSFAKEAVDALVRHMENSPETVVILATYESDMEKLLSSNDGLHSRFSRGFVFPDYTSEELWLILKHIAARDNYTIPEEARAVCLDYFDKLKSCKGKDFGNGREARRLFEHALEELAVRAADDLGCELEPTVQDFEQATRLLPAAAPAPRRIGF